MSVDCYTKHLSSTDECRLLQCCIYTMTNIHTYIVFAVIDSCKFLIDVSAYTTLDIGKTKHKRYNYLELFTKLMHITGFLLCIYT